DDARRAVQKAQAEPRGTLRLTCGVEFGMIAVSGWIERYLQRHAQVRVEADFTARLVDIVHEGFDCAVRVGDLADSSLVSMRLADNRRLCVGAPAYLKRAGMPQHPDELARHACLVLSSDASQSRGWAFTVDGQLQHIRPVGRLDCSDGQVLHDWCLAGLGLAWRSTWEVEADVAAGRLLSVLDDFAAPPNGIYALIPQRKHLPLRVRLWIDFLKHHYGSAEYWQRQGRAPEAHSA
ncbi:MAG TPA: substrate binding domain-containing protein, partial [Burkholderiaceae bacterium]|nr:substrate binding domain-containing protein [Burkholderiaceae bacterium]